MLIAIVRYIPKELALAYRRKGWEVMQLPGNHGRYRFLAWLPSGVAA